MSDSCENCGKPVLDSDTVCWHCGYQLRSKAGRAAAADQSAVAAAVSAPDTPDAAVSVTNLRSLVIYGALTVLVIASLWAVMSALSRQPILVRSADRSLGNDWLAVTDSDLIYTISLPAGWQWLDVTLREQRDALNNLMVRQGYIDNALRPLGGGVDDLSILAVGLDAPTLEFPDPTSFVVVARSEALGDLTPEAAIRQLRDLPNAVVEPVPDTHIPGQPQARFTVLDAERNYQCRHLAVQDEISATYLVAACAPQTVYGRIQRDFQSILDSFQFLEN